MTTNELVNMVVELAKEVDAAGSIVDFGMLNIDEDAAYHLLASQVVEGYYEMFDGNLVAMATVTALLVENFALNVMLKLKGVQDV